MIELFEGVPGSGKSYYAVAERFLPAVRKGRRLYLYVDGIYLDRLATFTGLPLEELTRQITVWRDPLDVLAMHGTVEPQSLVIVDEAQTVFRALERVDKALLRWLETHRHYGVDVLLCCQDYRQVSSSVTRLVEATVKFRKLAMVGLHRHSQGKVRGNPEDEEVIRSFTFTYSPAVYAYYASYAAAAIREEPRAHSIWKSAKVATGVAAGLFALALFLWRPWISLD
ncbi:MAG: zonular occludens toxin domain-containing protein, partial [Candidatus Eremiobacterota bacterium]